MEILENKQSVAEIVKKHAKYQKVMLLHDNTVSNLEINSIYNLIKDICIFNKVDVSNFDVNEIFNGYKAVIYICSTDNFLKLNFNRSEFVNVFMPTDNGILPYFLSCENKIDVFSNYLINDKNIDEKILTSIYFNKFYNYFKSVLMLCNYENNGLFEINLSNQKVAIEVLNSMNDDEFIDIDILKKTNMSYKHLSLVNLILIDGFLLLISNIKNKTYELVDVYKSCKENYKKLDKIYAMVNNESFSTLISLNFNCLFNLCKRTKEKILEYCILTDVTKQDIEKVFDGIKAYAKESEDILSYLYVFNFFNL